MTDIERSNSLTDLAARIKAEHEAIKASLRESVEHAFAAGEMLIEAKAQLKHGQWLPWLSEHCTISEQLYMRCAKNRAEIEKSMTGRDLTLTEAAAMLVMSSDVKKLLEFVRQADKLTDPEEFIGFCAENGVAVMRGNIFNAPEPTDQEWVEWNLFQLFLVQECAYTPESAAEHTDWVQSRGTLLKDWMGETGISFRARCGAGPAQKAVDQWNVYLENNRHRTLEDVQAEFKREDQARVEKLKLIQSTGQHNGRKFSKKDRRLVEEELGRHPCA